MLENPVFVGLVLPVVPAVIVLIVMTRALRRTLGPVTLIAVTSCAAIALYILLVILLQKAGIEP